MSFLTPLYIAGALFVALPILFHLIRRSPRDRVPFSSLMFLRESPPRVTRRSRLENLLLLVLRAAALALLAVAFARPFLREPLLADSVSDDGRVVAVLVDTSASMRRTNLWQQVIAGVQRLVSDARPIDHVAVFAFDRQMRPVISFEQWLETPPGARTAMVKEQLEKLQPSWNATHIGAALATAADAVDSHAGQFAAGGRVPEQLVTLFSDLQRGSDLAGLRQYDWPERVRLEARTVAPRAHTNAGIQLVQEREEAAESVSTDRIRVRISNASDSEGSRFRLHWAGATNSAVEVYVPPSKSRVIQAPTPPAAGAAEQLIVEGDDFDFDNTTYVIARRPETVTVLFLGRGSADDPKLPRYYFERAFPESRWRSVRILAHDPSDRLAATELIGVRFAVQTDSVSDETAAVLRDFVHAGGTLLGVLADQTVAASVGRVIGIDDWSVDDAPVRDYAMLGELDFSHPLFAPFSDPRYGDFTKIHFWRHRHVDASRLEGVRVLARFDDRDPALIELPLGRGRVLVLTAGWQPDDSQLSVSSKFVPLLGGMLDLAAGTADIAGQYRVGDAIILPDPAAESHRMRLPDGTEITLPPRAEEFSDTTQPGLYSLVGGATPLRFAVNLDPAESDTAPLPVEELEQLGVRLTDTKSSATIVAEAAEGRQVLAFELESRQKLWRWLAVAALAVLLAETWLSGFVARRTATQG